MTYLRLLPCLDGRIQIGRAVWILVALPQATVLHWARVLSPRVARNSQPLHFHLLKQSTGLLALGLAKRCGYDACLGILVSCNKFCHLYCVTIKVVLQLLAIQSFMLAQIILRSNITLFARRCWMVPLPSSIAVLKTTLLTSSPKPYLIQSSFL